MRYAILILILCLMSGCDLFAQCSNGSCALPRAGVVARHSAARTVHVVRGVGSRIRLRVRR